MPAKDAPTRALGGSVSNYTGLGYGWPTDQAEHVPEMVWPASVKTLARMRTDPTIASVVAAYTTPLLAADWAIDPAGSTKEMAQICADSLGLPLLGEQKKDAGAQRQRGVKWVEHVRLASLHLVWGHMAFEPIYEVRSGKAYLSRLPERMPDTIAEIRVNQDGTLRSIWQQGFNTPAASAIGQEIPADRLLWYAHQREGDNWFGRSLLRTCYADWLLKLDTKRVAAISMARFGAGTPIAEPLPGVQVTPAEIQEAQRLAQAIRVGQSGGAVSPKFTIKIKGVEGTLPDATQLLRYYDEQIRAGALTSLMDLGNSAHGSRALGDTFQDVLTRALNSVAQSMAETATQLCERLTTFNLGEDKPSPKVVAQKIGASSATIAQTVAELMASGLITADTNLETWGREAFSLPEKAPEPEPAAVDPATGEPAEGAPEGEEDQALIDAIDQIAAAAGDPRTYREPTEDETAAGIDPAAIDADHDALLAAAAAVLAPVVVGWGAAAVAQLAVAMGAAVALGPAAVAHRLSQLTLTLGDDNDLAALIRVLQRARQVGVAQAMREAARAGVALPGAPPAGGGDVASIAATVLARAKSGFGARVLRRARQWIGRPAGEAAEGAVGEVDIEALVRQVSLEAINAAMGGGRVMGQQWILDATPGIDWVIFHSAIRDGVTCRKKPRDRVPGCWEHDKHRYGSLAEAAAEFIPGRWWACRGEDRCRCIIGIRPVPAPEVRHSVTDPVLAYPNPRTGQVEPPVQYVKQYEPTRVRASGRVEAAGWSESKHPRDGRGRFGDGPGLPPKPTPPAAARFRTPQQAMRRLLDEPGPLIRDLFDHDLPGGHRSVTTLIEPVNDLNDLSEEGGLYLANGIFLNPAGNVVGSFTRSIHDQPKPGLVPPFIHNEVVGFKPEHRDATRGKGIGRTFVVASNVRAAREGFTAVYLHAAGNGGNPFTGGYVWAEAGYDFATPTASLETLPGGYAASPEYLSGNRELLHASIILRTPWTAQWLNRNPELLDEWIALLDRTAIVDSLPKDNPARPIDWANLGKNSPHEGTWLGKQLMLHSWWKGVMRFNTPNNDNQDGPPDNVQASAPTEDDIAAAGPADPVLAEAWRKWAAGEADDDAYVFDAVPGEDPPTE